MDIQKVLKEIEQEIQPFLSKGQVADYIPALASAPQTDFAMSVIDLKGNLYSVGKSSKRFSIQSISKVFGFSMALNIYGKDLYKRVGVEPSGDPFNSLIQLEHEHGIPRNPFINAGAIVITDTLVSHFGTEVYKKIQTFISEVSGISDITFSEDIYKSELKHGFRNYALINMMKSFGNIKNDIHSVIHTYFKQCSIMMNTDELAKSMLYLANNGQNPFNQKQILSDNRAKRINSVMLTCGHYDASGEFAFKVGLPGKSGVGGGIVAVVPHKMGIAVYSPGLNKRGNSLVGSMAMELFTHKTGLSIF